MLRKIHERNLDVFYCAGSLVVEYDVANVVTRVRPPAGA